MKSCVVVLGMHRSGTSVITKALELFGVELGQDLIPVADDNLKGFWEDKSIIELNDRILALAGMTWFSVFDYPFALLDSEQGKTFEDEAVNILESRFANRTLWGFKDPRCAKLLPFWQRVFLRLNDVAARYIFVLRNPLDIAASLQRRNDFNLAMNQHLWLTHTFPNLALLEDKEACFVSFDHFLTNPHNDLERIANHFGLSLDAEKTVEFISEFLSPDLRHSHSSPVDLIITPGVFPFVEKLYRILNQVAEGTVHLSEVMNGWAELNHEYISTTHASLHEFCLHAHT
ncbi:hypothetical protein KAR10_06000, partial [bacterium]|nr:hypothetical protein [bacterium]